MRDDAEHQRDGGRPRALGQEQPVQHGHRPAPGRRQEHVSTALVITNAGYVDESLLLTQIFIIFLLD